MRMTHTDRICLPGPMSHVFSLVSGAFSAIGKGSTIVVPHVSFDPRSTLYALGKEKCTALLGVPTTFQSIIAQKAHLKRTLPPLEKAAIGGSVASPSLLEGIQKELGVKHLVNAYGMTETSTTCCYTQYKDQQEKILHTIGQPAANIEAKIADKSGKAVPIGTPGELCFRGYLVMKGYWGDPKATEEVIDSQGWMHTGDIGVMDDDHCVRIVDREKDLIIRGGENISPSEVEAFFSTHPSIEEIHVVGEPDPLYGETVSAWIKIHPGYPPVTIFDLRDFAKGHLALFKIPSKVRIVDSFPTSPAGKVLRQRMREQTNST